MTLSTNKRDTVKEKKDLVVNEVFEKQRLFRPVVLDWTKKDLVVFTDTWHSDISAMDVSTKTPKLKVLAKLPSYVIRSPELGFTSNAAGVYDSTRKAPMIYVFGCSEYPYAVSFNGNTHKWQNLNPNDENGLQIAKVNKISENARTCHFIHKYILITSEENGLLVYDIEKNKFIIRTWTLIKYANNRATKIYGHIPPLDMHYFCKIKEISKTEEEFMAICKPYMVFIRVEVQDNGKTFVIHTRYLPNVVTNKGLDVRIFDYGCYYWKKHKVLLIIGGVCTALKEAFQHIQILDVNTLIHTVSRVVLPVPLRSCGVAYMQATDSLYIVGGANMRCFATQKTFWIKMDAFKEDIERIKNPQGKKMGVQKQISSKN